MPEKQDQLFPSHATRARRPGSEDCLFCRIIGGQREAYRVFEDSISVAFLDHRPLFPGHCLLAPRAHYETLADLPPDLTGAFFLNAQMLSVAVEAAMQAGGTFVGINNRVSQSVPHLHVHIVPRRKGDGLRGFFWPRTGYKSPEEAVRAQQAIKEAVAILKDRS